MAEKIPEGTLGNCSPNGEKGFEYRSWSECGVCNKLFNTMDLDAHYEKEHPPEPPPPLPAEPAQCQHYNVTIEFTGLFHMDMGSASGYFKDVCNDCGEISGEEYLVEFVRQ